MWPALLNKLLTLTHTCTQGGITAYLERGKVAKFVNYKMPFEYQTHTTKPFLKKICQL